MFSPGIFTHPDMFKCDINTGGKKPTPDVYQVNQIIPISNGVELAILSTLHKHRGRSLDGIEVWFGIWAGLEKEKKREEEEEKKEEKEKRKRRRRREWQY